MLVFKVFSQNSVRQRLVPTSLLVEVFKVSSQDRFRGVRPRSLPFPLLVEVFKIFSQDRVLPLLRTFQLVFMKTQMSLVKGFFALLPKTEKCDTTSARRLLMTSPWCSRRRRRSPSTDPDFAVEYVECDGHWWECESVPARQQYCWWLAAAGGSQVGHCIWRPPWLIGSGPG